MGLLQDRWDRAPLLVRLGLCFASIVAMVLGGSAGGYWD